jgi:cytoskeleton protein RodZ
MASVGERLRNTREGQGRDIAEIAAEIRVQPRYIEAIEAGDLSALPGRFFTRSFVRQYAECLEIPASEIESDLERWLSSASVDEPPSLQPRNLPTGLAPISHMGAGRRQRSRVLGSLIALVAVIGGCAAVYSFWLRTQDSATLPTILPDPVPVEDVTPAPPAMPPPAEETPDLPPAAAVSAGGIPEPASSAPSVSGEGGPLWFEMTATDETWVRVSAGDRTLYVGILENGDSRRFSGIEEAVLRVGNAGGLTISVNGGAAQPVGQSGQIRLVTLTPGKMEAMPPPRARPDSEEEGSSSEGRP